MIIHKGKKYTIECKGDVAEKTDGKSIRRMRYYPERDASALAGEIDELTAWRLLRDISRQASVSKTPISPEHILIDGEEFILSEWSESSDDRFNAPEGYEPVWALAASVFQIFLGCHVFQGMGGRGQSSTAPVPVLRRELPELSTLIARSLSYITGNRPTLREIEEIAEANVSRCESLKTEFPPRKEVSSHSIPSDELDKYWPEEMN